MAGILRAQARRAQHKLFVVEDDDPCPCSAVSAKSLLPMSTARSSFSGLQALPIAEPRCVGDLHLRKSWVSESALEGMWDLTVVGIGFLVQDLLVDIRRQVKYKGGESKQRPNWDVTPWRCCGVLVLLRMMQLPHCSVVCCHSEESQHTVTSITARSQHQLFDKIVVYAGTNGL